MVTGVERTFPGATTFATLNLQDTVSKEVPFTERNIALRDSKIYSQKEVIDILRKI